MNSLITLGTVAAFGYSTFVTLAPSLVPTDVREVYFEAVGVIITLIILSRLLEARAKAGTGASTKRTSNSPTDQRTPTQYNALLSTANRSTRSRRRASADSASPCTVTDR